MNAAQQFFYFHAGYSYDPKIESSEQGRLNSAYWLALAEQKATEHGFSFQWEVDELDSSEFSDEQPPWQLWCCVMRDSNGEALGSLGGIDFGRDGEPWEDPYRRVVEAEIALSDGPWDTYWELLND